MTHSLSSSNEVKNNTALFTKISDDLRSTGYSINPLALPEQLGEDLLQQLISMEKDAFHQAEIGRNQQLTRHESIRKDEICWITDASDAGRDWLNWLDEAQQFFNRHLFLGLFSSESHFAHYSPGDFYKRHFDAFKGEGNRILSIVVYLNHDWKAENGGELVLFENAEDQQGIKVIPDFGTVVVFLSDEFPHEVLPAHHDRYSIASWFHINTSTTKRVDPPS